MKRIQVYSCEKYDKKGDGRVMIEVETKDVDPKDVKDQIKRIREQYKAANTLYRQQNKTKGNKEPTLKELDLKSSQHVNLQLDKDTGNTTVILASSKRGKSNILKYLYDKYYNKKDFVTTLFSISSHIPLYKDAKKRLIKVSKFDNECVSLIKKMRLINHKCKNKYNFCAIFDDIIDVRYSSIVNNLILTYRNSNISSILSLQYPKLLAKSSRGSVNNIILGAFNVDESIIVALNAYLKSIFDRRFGVKKEVDQINLYRKLTDDYHFLYLHPESGTLERFKLKLN